MNTAEQKWIYGLALVVCLAALFWFARDSIEALVGGSADEPPAPLVETKPIERKPLYPLEQPDVAEPGDNPEEREALPPLEDSDSFVRALLIELFGDGIEDLLSRNELAYKIVATTDSLTTAKPSRKIWPVQSRLAVFAVLPVAVPADKPADLPVDMTVDVPAGMPANSADNSPDSSPDSSPADKPGIAEFYPSPTNYQRYDFLVNLATSANPATLAAAYRRIYPLLQESYIGLGYPEGYFNDRLVAVIDHLLSTPEPAEPLLLVRPRILYEYADPRLEALSGSQKLLLRMGPDNAGAVRRTLREFRKIIAVPAPD